MRAPRVTAALCAAALLAGCGGEGGDTTTTPTTTTTTGGRPPLRCAPGGERAQADAQGDVLVSSSTAPERPARSPSADLVSVAVRPGARGVVCVRFRTAGPVRLGSSFSFTTRQGDVAQGIDEQRYEVQLTPDGRVNVSRPHGEPRYPVRARVVRRGDTLEVALATLPLSPGYRWRADLSYLPRFPLGGRYADALPGGEAWVPSP